MVGILRWRPWRGAARRAAARGDRLRDAGRWDEAAAAYAEALARDPGRAGVWVQRGHALKEAGRIAEAAEAYRRAAALRPGDRDAWLHLAHAEKRRGALDAAAEAFRALASLDPAAIEPARELAALGAAAAEPAAAAGLAAVAAELRAIREALARCEALLPDVAAIASPPPALYGLVREQWSLAPPPPGPPPALPVEVHVDAEGAGEDAVQATLASLRRQSLSSWGFAAGQDGLRPRWEAIDSRPGGRMPEAGPGGGALAVACRAGAVLAPEALAWLAAAAARTGYGAAWADEESLGPGPGGAVPRLRGGFDLDLLLAEPPPALAAFAPDVWRAAGAGASGLGARVVEGFLEAWRCGRPIASVARMLAAAPPEPPHAIRAAALAGYGAAEPRPLPLPEDAGRSALGWRPRDPDAPITAVIPSHDRPDLLERCVGSLRAMASAPGRLRIVVVDHAGAEPATRAYLAAGEAAGLFRALRDDGPFDWSRLNNRGAEGAAEGILAFVNDDAEMLSPGWDETVRGFLQRPDAGALGARLIYPSRRIQHAGMAFGGRIEHEGRHLDAADGGPGGRFRQSRAAASVTGAFLATPTAVFAAAGRLPEGVFPTDFSDVDYCLRVRALGRLVFYAPLVTLLHRESESRRLDGAAMAAAEAAEARLRRRWGAALGHDPAMNPLWVRSGQPFRALSPPSGDRLWRWIEAAARPDRWRPDPDG